MVSLHPEFIIDQSKHTKAVVLPFSEWEQVLADLEELDDIRAYDAATASAQDSFPFEAAVREIRADYNE